MRMVTPSEIEKSGENPSGPLILEATCTPCQPFPTTWHFQQYECHKKQFGHTWIPKSC